MRRIQKIDNNNNYKIEGQLILHFRFDKHFCRRTNKQESIKLNSNETNVTKVYLKNRIYYHRIQPEGLTAVFFLNTETLFLFFLF